jgi:hypothetical protein
MRHDSSEHAVTEHSVTIAEAFGGAAAETVAEGADYARPTAFSEPRSVRLLAEPPGERLVTLLPPLHHAPEAPAPTTDLAGLMRLAENGQAERAAMLERLAAEQRANSEMRRLFAQYLAAREREKERWQDELDTARAEAELERGEREVEQEKRQRAVAEVVGLEDRYKTHKANWIFERRRLQSHIEALEAQRGWKSWLGGLFGGRRAPLY